MILGLFTSSRTIEQLKKDVDDLSNLVELPCEFEKVYEKNEDLKHIFDPAYCSLELEAIKGHYVIVVNPHYFNFDELSRKLILLHELIHACQRMGDLSGFDKRFTENIIKINKILLDYPKNKDLYFFKKIFTRKIIDIMSFAGWIFEIWDELFLKQKHGKFEEKKHQVTFEMIKRDCSEHAYEQLGTWKKYSVLIYLVRATYLKKITKDLTVSSKYADLANCLEDILKTCVSNNEFLILQNKLDCLTYVEEFDMRGLAKLEKAYDDMVDEMINMIKLDYD